MLPGRWPSLVLAAGCLFLSLPAVAQAPSGPSAAAPKANNERVARARELFDRGAALAHDQRWRDALAAFKQSATLRPHAVTTYNIGYCERALGHVTRARKYFKQALRDNAARGGTELPKGLEGAAEQYLREAEAQIATATVTLGPEGASLAVDGRPLELESAAGKPPVLVAGTRPPGDGEPAPAGTFTLHVDPGAHVFVVTAKGQSRIVDERFAAGERRTLRLELPVSAQPAAPPTPAPRPVQTPPTADQPPPGWTSQRTWAVVLGGAGVAGLAAGTFFGVRAASRWSDAKTACPGLTACPDDRGATLSTDAHRDGDLSTIAFVAGGAALGSAAVLWLTAPPLHPERPTVGASFGSHGAALVVDGTF